MTHTDQQNWVLLNQATANVTNGYTADINTYALAYGGTWTTSVTAAGGACAQNPANRNLLSPLLLPYEVNGIRLRFIVANANDEYAASTIWAWDCNGSARDILVINPIQAGTSVCAYEPQYGTALTNYFYADVATISVNNCNATAVTASSNGIAEVYFDGQGISYLFADFKFSDASATQGTDCIVEMKWW